jgi:hypothetical protein
VRFDKGGHSATLTLPHGWGMQDERIVARVDGASVQASVRLAGVADDEPVTVYVVGGPDVQAADGEAGGTAFTMLSPTSHTVPTLMGGRHFAARVPNGGTVCFECALGFCLYVLYVTNEPPTYTTAASVEVS